MLSVLSGTKKQQTPLRITRPEGLADVLTSALPPSVRPVARSLLASALLRATAPNPSDLLPPQGTANAAAEEPDLAGSYLSLLQATPPPPSAADFFSQLAPPAPLAERLPAPPQPPTLQTQPEVAPEARTLSGLLALAFPYIGLDVLAAPDLAAQQRMEQQNEAALRQYQMDVDRYRLTLQREAAISEDEWNRFNVRLQNMQEEYRQALAGWQALRDDIANAAKMQLSLEADRYMAELESALRQKEQALRVDAETRQQLALALFRDTALQAMLASAPEPVLEALKAYGVVVSPEFAQALRTSPGAVRLMLSNKALEMQVEKQGFELQKEKRLLPLEEQLLKARTQEALSAVQRNIAQARAAASGGGVAGLTPVQMLRALVDEEEARMAGLARMRRELQEAGGSSPLAMADYAKVWQQTLVLDGKPMTARQAVEPLFNKAESLIMNRRSLYLRLSPENARVVSQQTQELVESAAGVLRATAELKKQGGRSFAGEAAPVIASAVMSIVNLAVPPEQLVVAVDVVGKKGVPGASELARQLSQQGRSTNQKLNIKKR